MGGEKVGGDAVQVTALESPPRGRGKVIAQRHALFGVGITPAWAGKSGAGYADKGRPGDHPRMGGEKACVTAL